MEMRKRGEWKGKKVKRGDESGKGKGKCILTIQLFIGVYF